VNSNTDANYSIRVTCFDEGRSLTYFEETQPVASGSISDMMLSSSHACLVLFSLVDRASFRHVEEKWIPNVVSTRGSKCPILLVGTMLDLKNKTKNSTELVRLKSSASSVPPWNPEKDTGYSINSVPVEVLFRIFDYLDLKSLSAASLTCKNWSVIIQYPYVWKNRSKGGVDAASITALRKKFKEIVFYTEISIGVEPKKMAKISKELLRKAIQESAVSGRPPKPPPGARGEYEPEDDDYLDD
jgi:GTPase SAR1 family protein